MPTLVRYGDEGALVTALHAALTSHGLRVASNEVESRQFGRSTLAALLEFQRRHKLPVDGTVGHATWGALGRLFDGSRTL